MNTVKGEIEGDNSKKNKKYVDQNSKLTHYSDRDRII